jgi:hypothetical protein
MATGLATRAGRVAWVVGMRAGKGVPRRPWAVRRTTSGWSEVPPPNLGADAGFMAVSVEAGGGAWAVGFRTVSRELRPVAARWDGRRWRAASPPGVAGRSAALVDVAATLQGPWAVGYRMTASGPRPYAIRRRSGAWERVDPVLPRGRFGALTAVMSHPRHGIWAVGWQAGRRGLRPLVVERRGSRWRRVPPATNDLEDAVLTGVTADRRGVWAVGYRTVQTGQSPVLLRVADGTWTHVGLRGDGTSLIPDDLVVDATGGLLLVGGGRWAGKPGSFHAAARLDPPDLALTARPAGIKGTSHLRAVVRDGDDLMAVGWTDGRAIAVSSCRRAQDASDGAGVAVAAQGDTRPQVDLAGAVEGAGSPGASLVADATAPPDPAARRSDGRRRPVRTESPGRAASVAVRFRDVAAAAGLPTWTSTYGATRLDLDGDGWDDLVISRHTAPGRILLNRRGRFVDAPSDPLPRRDRHGCAAADVDRDGRDDLYCAIGAARGLRFKSNELYLDLHAPRPGNLAAAHGVSEPFGRGRRAAFVDVDGDPYPDLLVTSDPLRVDGLPAVNRLYRGTGGGGLQPAPELGLDLPIGGDCVFSAQLDGTGPPEIVICTDEPWRGGRGLHVFRRTHAGYRDATRALGLRPMGDVDAVAADFDGDGRIDLAQLSSTRLVVSLQRDGRLRRVLSMAVRHGTALAAGDVNGDGRADLYIVQGGPANANDRLLVNDGSGRRFRDASIPQARGGSADGVVALDFDRNGLTDFLVLNGRHRHGPIQLIASFRR